MHLVFLRELENLQMLGNNSVTISTRGSSSSSNDGCSALCYFAYCNDLEMGRSSDAWGSSSEDTTS